eukprot:TRINITY_DN1415_c0_g2_i1.p1 TRINITY_DN1415_c0_g2~~TRINITY_DN1415_c0_g2_i1.p1  ORF type:complete len:932 (+),score=213.36 TRINITY_DN1415_c0_g2_i1:153-2948(+)
MRRGGGAAAAAAWPPVASFLVLALCLVCASVYCFTRGFLLTRVQLSDTTADAASSGTVDRAVILVVDALRFDFAAPRASAAVCAQHRFPDSPYFHGRLPVVQQLLREEPSRAHLFEFVADPPTTTMQRLKGLTTGGLPAFFEVSKNFASTAIEEDNIINQLVAHDKRIVFVGDDTWMGLFPTQFNKSYPYPSLDVKDLHTVDNGVMARITPALLQASDEWDVIVGHMLGVDHVGHRFGPSHDEMTRKLAQVNAFIEQTVRALPPRTALFVFGDHGMTPDGNHGGGTFEEVTAALFVYLSPQSTPVGRPNEYPAACFSAVRQVDFVPTFAAMLGLPIPYSNVGAVIPELLPADVLHEALHANAMQVHSYMNHYSAVTGIRNVELDQLDIEFDEAEASFRALHKQKGHEDTASALYRRYFDHVFSLCSRIWTTFDLPLMRWGCSLSALVVGCLLLQLLSVDTHFPTWAVAFGAGCGLVLSPFTGFQIVSLAATGAAVGFLVARWRTRARTLPSMLCDWPGAVALVLTCLHTAGFFSNSFIEAEPAVVRFLIMTGLALVLLLLVLREPRPGLVWPALLLICVVRCLHEIAGDGAVTHVEQQQEQQQGAVATAVALASAAPYAVIVFAVWKSTRFFYSDGNVKLPALAAAARWFGLCSLLCVGAHWTLASTSTLPPRIAYAAGAAAIACTVACPPISNSNPRHAAACGMLLAVTPLVAWALLLLGPRSTAAVACLCAQLVAFVWVHRYWACASRADPGLLLGVMWALFALQYFSQTGHTYQFSGIHFDAAFVGFEHTHLSVGALLVAYNTFAAPILCTMALPFIVVFLQEPFDPRQSIGCLAQPLLSYVLVFCLDLCGSMTFAFIARRHLMVWRLFCPKYVFEAAMCLCVCCTALLAVLLLRRVLPAREGDGSCAASVGDPVVAKRRRGVGALAK